MPTFSYWYTRNMNNIHNPVLTLHRSASQHIYSLLTANEAVSKWSIPERGLLIQAVVHLSVCTTTWAQRRPLEDILGVLLTPRKPVKEAPNAAAGLILGASFMWIISHTWHMANSSKIEIWSQSVQVLTICSLIKICILTGNGSFFVLCINI